MQNFRVLLGIFLLGELLLSVSQAVSDSNGALPVVCSGCTGKKDVWFWKCTLVNSTSITKIPIPIWFESENEVVLASKHSIPVSANQELRQYGVEKCTLFSDMDTIRLYDGLARDAAVDKDRQRRQTGSPATSHQSYHTFASMRDWFRGLAANRSSLVKFVPEIGRSHGRVPLFAVHVTKNMNSVNRTEKPKIYIQCLLHAREWISGSVCRCLVDFLSVQPQSRPVARLLEHFEYVFVPVANPDGYILTWTNYPAYRFWRKNTAYFSPLVCGGVDLNRNFKTFWEPNSVHCSEVFPGLRPHSEPEVLAITSYIHSISPVVAAIDFHAYQQLVLTPYSGSNRTPSFQRKMKTVASKVAQAMSKTHSTNYTSRQANRWYLAKGSFLDWMYSKEVVKNNTDSSGHAHRALPMLIELRPRKEELTYDGFLVPPEQILPICQEVFQGVLKLSKLMLKNPLKN